MSSSLLSMGAYGCIYYPSIDKKKKYVSKLQIKNHTSFNEINISNIIKTIKNYHKYFAIIQSSKDVDIKNIDNNVFSECTPIQKRHYKSLVISSIKYIPNYNLDDYYLNNDSIHLFLNAYLKGYLQILYILNLLNKKKICHYDLHGGNIIINKYTEIPIVIDFGLAVRVNNIKYLKRHFYIYAPECRWWCLEIHLCCYITKYHANHLNKIININELKNVIDEIYVTNYNAIKNYISDELYNCLIDRGKQFIELFKNKTYKETIEILISYYKKWDIFAISIMHLAFLFKYIKNNIYNNDFLENLVELLISNCSPFPGDRYDYKTTYSKLNNILKNKSIKEYILHFK